MASIFKPFPVNVCAKIYSGVAVNQSPTLPPSSNESSVSSRQRHLARASTFLLRAPES